MMSGVVLANGIEFGDWIYFVVLALGAIGGVLGKRKQQSDARKRQQAAAKPKPGARPRVPAMPARPRPAATRPPTPVRARAVTPRPQPPKRFPSEPRPSRRMQVERPRIDVAVAGPPVMGRPIGEPQAEPAAPVPSRPQESLEVVRSPVEARRRLSPRRSADLRALRRVLQTERGLRRAVILSEILAPPVALRENHPS